jgi:uncharacterized glyoxalase superfamily protein PhnB
MIVNRSAPTATIVPLLIYDDVGKAIDWLCGAFFAERLACRTEWCRGSAPMVVAEGSIMPRQVYASLVWWVPVCHRACWDVDRHFEQAKQFGARIVAPPHDQPFGERQYTADDYAGHRWTFSQHIADVAPHEWGATLAESK